MHIQKTLDNHPHIVKFIGAAGNPPKSMTSAEFIIVTELIEGLCI